MTSMKSTFEYLRQYICGTGRRVDSLAPLIKSGLVKVDEAIAVLIPYACKILLTNKLQE